MYEIFEHNKAAFQARFRDHAMRMMRKYRFEFVALGEATSDQGTELVYLLPEDRVLTPTAYSPSALAPSAP